MCLCVCVRVCVHPHWYVNICDLLFGRLNRTAGFRNRKASFPVNPGRCRGSRVGGNRDWRWHWYRTPHKWEDIDRFRLLIMNDLQMVALNTTNIRWRWCSFYLTSIVSGYFLSESALKGFPLNDQQIFIFQIKPNMLDLGHSVSVPEDHICTGSSFIVRRMFILMANTTKTSVTLHYKFN